MTASADVSTETKSDVVGVPIQSVAVRTIDQLTLEGEEVSDAEKRFTADDDGFVEIVFCMEEDGSVVARQVKTGIQSDDLIEIVSGVDADDEVVTGSYRAISTDLQNGAQVSVNNDEDGESNDVMNGVRNMSLANQQRAILSLRDVVKTYVMGDEAVHALSGVSIDIERERICCHHGAVWLRQVDLDEYYRLPGRAYQRYLFARW